MLKLLMVCDPVGGAAGVGEKVEDVKCQSQGENAGKASSCAGCPNQSVCASGEAKKKDPALADVQDRLSQAGDDTL